MDLKSTGKTKEEIKEMYNKYFYETFQRFDFIAEKGEDDYVIDETGKRYLDFMAGFRQMTCSMERTPFLNQGKRLKVRSFK